jgi:hypothetical protein
VRASRRESRPCTGNGALLRVSERQYGGHLEFKIEFSPEGDRGEEGERREHPGTRHPPQQSVAEIHRNDPLAFAPTCRDIVEPEKPRCVVVEDVALLFGGEEVGCLDRLQCLADHFRPPHLI